VSGSATVVVTAGSVARGEERRADIGGLEESVLHAEKRAWERTDFFNQD
jgi:hypothetical protein